MGMNLCGRCLDGIIEKRKVSPLENKMKWAQTFCDNCKKPSLCFHHPEAIPDHFFVDPSSVSEVDKRQGLIALKITKGKTAPVEYIDKKLLNRALELHQEIKKLSKEGVLLKQQKTELLEENRDLRKRLEKLEKKELGPYQD